MSSRVTFIPVCDSLSELQVENKCSFCNVFTDKVNKNFCFACSRILNSIRENDIILLSYKPFWVHIAQHKTEYNMSWYDFECLENEIWGLVENLSFLNYDKSNLFYYLDTHNIAENKSDIVNGFSKINELINEEFNTNYNPDKKLQHNFKNFFDNFELLDSTNKFIYLATEEAKKCLVTSSFTINRRKLKELFMDKFDFYTSKR